MGNPHFLGRPRSTSHALLPALRQTGYPTRTMILDFVRLARESVDFPGAIRGSKAAVNDNVERLLPALESLVGILDENSLANLLTALWASYHIGEHGSVRLRRRMQQLEQARKNKTKAREFGLLHAAELRKKNPKWKLQRLVKETRSYVEEAMRAAGRKNYRLASSTVEKWLAQGRKRIIDQ
jgi:hypothetical protein